jgi:uncharacterized protein YbjT (DUF2867 family)
MNSVAIAGASGLVGGLVVLHLLRRDDVNRVVAVGRRRLPIEHDRLVSHVVDLAKEAEVASALPAISVAFCCLGSTIKQAGSREAFRAIDHDAVVTFAKAARARSVRRFQPTSSRPRWSDWPSTRAAERVRIVESEQLHAIAAA